MTTVYFNYAQISKSTIPFSGCTSLARVTIMNPVQLGANAFSGLPEGFVLSCPNKLSVSSLDASVFGTTKNPVIEVPDETTKEKVVAKLGTKAEVKVAGEGEAESAALVQGSDGNITGYESLEKAFEAINNGSDQGPLTITLRQNSENIVWPETAEAPNKEVTIDFSNNSVVLPANLTLRAPMTIKNIHNFNNTVLCNLTAGEYRFVMIDGGSFGFSQISGNNLTFSGKLPSSQSLGQPCQIIGAGENSTVTFENVGRSDYYYNMPSISGFSNLVLNNTFLNAQSGLSETGVLLNDGGLKLSADVTVKALGGNGELRLENGAALTVTGEAAGKTKIILDGSIPEDGTVLVKAVNAARDAFYLDGVTDKVLVYNAEGAFTLGAPIVSVNGGNIVGAGFGSMSDALNAIAGDDGEGTYMVALKENAKLETDSGSANTCTFPAKSIVIDGEGNTLSQPVTSRNYLRVNGNLTLKNVNMDMKMTYLYNDASGSEIVFDGTVTGVLGTVEDKSAKTAEGATFRVYSPISKSIISSFGGNSNNNYISSSPTTTVVLNGYGSENNPAVNRFNKQFVPSVGSSSTAVDKLVLENSWVPISTSGYDCKTIQFSGNSGISILAATSSTVTATINNLDASAAEGTVMLPVLNNKFTYLTVRGEVSGKVKVVVPDGEPEVGTVLVKAPNAAEDAFYLDGFDNKCLKRMDNGDYVVASWQMFV